MKQDFIKGVRAGIPIMLGYLSVSFGFGINAVALGLTVAEAVGISLTNVTSAGQAAGITVIAASGTLLEMVLCQMVINLRYSLMGFSLSQKLSTNYSTFHRLLTSFGITDEIFAVAVSRGEPVTPAFMYGIEIVSIFGWTVGTFLGAAAGNILPRKMIASLSLMLYGMFIAIIIPPAKKNFRVLIVILMSAALSVMIKFCFPVISAGFSVIICAVVSSVICALLFPRNEEEGGDG